MQILAILNRTSLDCNLYHDGKHESLSHRIKKQSDIDDWIAKLLHDGWHLFNVSGDDMYFIADQPQAANQPFTQHATMPGMPRPVGR